MPETVADKNITAFRFFLVNALADLFKTKCLLSIGREIYNRASLRLTKQVFNILHCAQTHRQQSFDRLTLNGFTFRPADRTGIRVPVWALKILRGNLTYSIPGFQGTTTRVNQ